MLLLCIYEMSRSSSDIIMLHILMRMRVRRHIGFCIYSFLVYGILNVDLHTLQQIMRVFDRTNFVSVIE